MPVIELRPSVDMAYEDHWFGPPWTTPETIVMIHGNSESSRAWTQWVPHLAARYRVVRPDLPGFGASSAPLDYGFTAKELAADIGRFLDALGIASCHLIGAKYGGSACMQFGSEQPHRLKSLCLFGSPVRGSGTGNADAIRLKGVRQWATRDHAGAARQRGVRGAASMVGRRAHGQDRAARRRSARRRRGSTWSSRPAWRGSPRRP